MTTFSIILPTCGRVDLALAAHSAVSQMSQHDELLIVGGGSWGEAVAFWAKARHLPHAGGNNFGNDERNMAIPHARKTHLLFIDDDDALLPGVLPVMRQLIDENPTSPHIFRMIASSELIIPMTPVLREGNIGTPNFVAPNVLAKLGVWGTRYEGDFDFITSTMAHYPDGPIWHDYITYACRQHGRDAWGVR